MNGVVDEFGRAIVTLEIQRKAADTLQKMAAWIDTAFNGELVVPMPIIEAMGFEQSAGIQARLADGNEVTLELTGDMSLRIRVIGRRFAVF